LDQCIDLFLAEHKKLLSQYRHHKSTCGRSDEKNRAAHFGFIYWWRSL